MAEFKWQGDLPKKLGQLDNVVRRAMYASCAYNAPRAEAYMKARAPWTDRTGNARNSLSARAMTPGGGKHGNVMALVLYSNVSYQFWLEVRFSGQYAILRPTTQVFGPKVMEMVGRLLDEAG